MSKASGVTNTMMNLRSLRQKAPPDADLEVVLNPEQTHNSAYMS